MSNKLFESYELSGKTLNNRMVMAPMTRARSANWGNVETELTATYYAQRATAGLYNGTIIINRAFNKETATQVLENNDADLVSFGVPFIANPDLVERFKTDSALNAPDQETFYTPGEKGYTDYPFLNQ
ncbi:hypothetical protein [Sphingobacterium sp. UBA7625]|uniref:oxidoreductase n=1 Tax=Sphingobacterium sp. UBA7625 TaxID=1947522 RepID=UPI00257DAB7F|nr:hypothetical protein [Sphingobacterium sp. UBA7625]